MKRKVVQSTTCQLRKLFWSAIGASFTAVSCSGQVTIASQQAAARQALAALHPIDAHAHVLESDPALTHMLEQWDLLIVDILVVDDKGAAHGSLQRQRAAALAFIHSAHGHASLCTTFDPFRFSRPDFQQSTIDQLNQDFANGAIAVKVWKNIGMELKDGHGGYVMVDDARFQPIFQDIAAHNKTLIAHQAEPDVAWVPDPKALDTSYYAEHPEWNMSTVAGAPSKATILRSRDHMLAENPGLRVIGAHLGSMEADVDLVAERLDRYPSFAIDTAARVPHLVIQPSLRLPIGRGNLPTTGGISPQQTPSTTKDTWSKVSTFLCRRCASYTMTMRCTGCQVWLAEMCVEGTRPGRRDAILVISSSLCQPTR